MLLSPRQHQILSLMGVEVWHHLDRTQSCSTEQSIDPALADVGVIGIDSTGVAAVQSWCGWIRQIDSASVSVICELVDATNAFEAAEQKLLGNILFAIGHDLDQANLILVQPEGSDSQVKYVGNTEMVAAGANDLIPRLSKIHSDTTLVFGADFAKWLRNANQDLAFTDGCFVPFSLQQMLVVPELKRECWEVIKPLLPQA